jgi:hypothetical protein
VPVSGVTESIQLACRGKGTFALRADGSALGWGEAVGTYVPFSQVPLEIDLGF